MAFVCQAVLCVAQVAASAGKLLPNTDHQYRHRYFGAPAAPPVDEATAQEVSRTHRILLTRRTRPCPQSLPMQAAAPAPLEPRRPSPPLLRNGGDNELKELGRDDKKKTVRTTALCKIGQVTRQEW